MSLPAFAGRHDFLVVGDRLEVSVELVHVHPAERSAAVATDREVPGLDLLAHVVVAELRAHREHPRDLIADER